MNYCSLWLTNHQLVIHSLYITCYTYMPNNMKATYYSYWETHKAEQCALAIYGHSFKAIDIILKPYSVISLDNKLKLIVCTAARNLIKLSHSWKRCCYYMCVSDSCLLLVYSVHCLTSSMKNSSFGDLKTVPPCILKICSMNVNYCSAS